MVTVICGAVTAALFAANAAITGEFNYQGGDRKTFYHHTGISVREHVGNVRQHRSRERPRGSPARRCAREHALGHGVPSQSLVFPGRPQRRPRCRISFPACSPSRCFSSRSRSRRGNGSRLPRSRASSSCTCSSGRSRGTAEAGPIGSRYFLPFYALFLVLIPPTVGVGTAIAAFLIGALFTAQIVLNPFYSSTHTGEHTKSGPLRILPIELTLINDLPVAQDRDRRMQPLGRQGRSPGIRVSFPMTTRSTLNRCHPIQGLSGSG